MLAAAAGLLASLAIFWLLSSITGDHRLAAAGVLFVLLTGTIFAGQGLIGVLLKLDIVSLGLPFLRRYQPAAMFFLFFIFCTFIWHALTSRQSSKSATTGLRWQGSALGSWFSPTCICGRPHLPGSYVWDCFGRWLRPAGQRRQGIEVFAIVSVMFALAVVPYAYLVSNRSQNSR